VVAAAAARRCEAASASSAWYSTLYGTAVSAPLAPRRIVVKNPVAACLAVPARPPSHCSTSALVASGG
jgi:hypothetical protein